MNFEFETNGINTYLVYEVQSSDIIDTMGLGMLTNNKILGLAPTIFTQLDTTRYIKYNVSSKISATNLFMSPINKKRLTGVFLGIVNAMLSAEDYMIDTNTILLDMDYIFADVSTCETTLICVPVVCEHGGSINLSEFFKDIMFKAKFDQTEDCDYVGKILNYLNSTPVFSLMEFKGVLDEIIMPAMKSSNNIQPQIQQVQIEQKKELQSAYVQPEVKKQPKESSEKREDIAASVNNSFELPSGNKSTVQNAGERKSKLEKTEKKMTMFKLLRNYNKENLALYKEQKGSKKKVKNNADNTGFNVPGQHEDTNVKHQEQEQNQQPEKYNQSQQNLGAENQEQQKIFNQQSYYEEPAYNDFGSVCPPTSTLTLSEYGQTSLLSKDMLAPVMPYFIRRRTNQRVDINKPVFRIGKERTFVDYFIPDNPAISRSHANIFTREGKYYVVDTNSLNHTYIDGVMIPSNQETELHSGNIVKLADEEFEFHV